MGGVLARPLSLASAAGKASASSAAAHIIDTPTITTINRLISNRRGVRASMVFLS